MGAYQVPWTATSHGADHHNGEHALAVTPCCARCRRGIKGFGELPCGYADNKCPNECHGKATK